MKRLGCRVTVSRGDGLALEVQDQRFAGAELALRQLLGLHPDPPVLALTGAVAGQLHVVRGAASADDFAQQALHSTQNRTLGNVFDRRGQNFLVVDVDHDDLKELLALKCIFLVSGRVNISDANTIQVETDLFRTWAE